MPTEVFIGVDVCKPRLDLMILPTGEILEFENSVKGIKQFVKRPKPEAILPVRCMVRIKKVLLWGQEARQEAQTDNDHL
jgi:hypothetical protein